MLLPSLKLSLLFIDVCEAGEVTENEPDRVPTGVFVFRGSPIDIDALTISLDDQGNISHSGGGLRSGLEIWPLWMRIAIDHESTAVVARSNIVDRWANANGEQQGELLQVETRACLVSMSASAFGLESLAISAAKRAGLPPTIGQRASSARRIAEVLKQCFVMTERQFLAWRSSAIQIFDARNEAVHPTAGSTAPLPHPAISTLVPRPVHVFRVENASAAITTALSMAQLASCSPKERLGRQFREGVSSWADFVQDLRDRRVQQPMGRSRCCVDSDDLVAHLSAPRRARRCRSVWVEVRRPGRLFAQVASACAAPLNVRSAARSSSNV